MSTAVRPIAQKKERPQPLEGAPDKGRNVKKIRVYAIFVAESNGSRKKRTPPAVEGAPAKERDF
jgi:hypothetical protein